MEINWFTLVAQIINFLILVFVLQRVLYKPIIRAMDQREEMISNRLQSAAQKEQEAQQEAQHYRQLQQDLEAQKAALLAQTKAEVEQFRLAQIQTVREDVDAMQGRWQLVVRQQQASFLRELRHQAIQQVQTTVRRVLADLADVDLERRLIALFLQRLHHLTEAEQQALDSLAGPENSTRHPVVIHSAFTISEPDRQAIAQALQQQLQQAKPLNVKFEINPHLICGIELRAPGCKLAWSVENYLDRFEERLATVFEEETGVGYEPG
ncbi:MAG: F0F1 ATP synthase subunit delta [Gloeobacterales cyanobacterium]